MAKCIWCGKREQLNKHKFCPECYDTIKDDILRCKDKLSELESKANPEMSEAEQKEILTQLREYCDVLKGYKEKEVPFFKSGYIPLQNKVYAKLGMPVEVPILRPGNKFLRMINFQSIVNFFVLPLLAIACIYLFTTNQSYSKEIAALQGTPEGEEQNMDSVPNVEDPAQAEDDTSSTTSNGRGSGGGGTTVMIGGRGGGGRVTSVFRAG